MVGFEYCFAFPLLVTPSHTARAKVTTMPPAIFLENLKMYGGRLAFESRRHCWLRGAGLMIENQDR